mgnify:CR=1 FL=1
MIASTPIGDIVSLPSKPISSITNKLPNTSAPVFSHNLAHAATVPPVASKSSTITTLSVSDSASSCISSVLEPYSRVYAMFIVDPGNFPGFRIGMNAIPSLVAIRGAKIKPLASGPIIAVGSQPFSLILLTNSSVNSERRRPSDRTGVMSRNMIPSIGKSGTVRTAPLSFCVMSLDMLTAPCGAI